MAVANELNRAGQQRRDTFKSLLATLRRSEAGQQVDAAAQRAQAVVDRGVSLLDQFAQRYPKTRRSVLAGMSVVGLGTVAGCVTVNNYGSGEGSPSAQPTDLPSHTVSPDGKQIGELKLPSGMLHQDHELKQGDRFDVPQGAGPVVVQGDLDYSTDGGKTWHQPYDNAEPTGLVMVYTGGLDGDKQLSFKAKVGGGDVQYAVSPNPAIDCVLGEDVSLMLERGCAGAKKGGCQEVTVVDLTNVIGGDKVATGDLPLGVTPLYKDRELKKGDIFSVTDGPVIAQGDLDVSFDGGKTWHQPYDSDGATGLVMVDATDKVNLTFKAVVGGGDVQYAVNTKAAACVGGNDLLLMMQRGCEGQSKGGCRKVVVKELTNVK